MPVVVDEVIISIEIGNQAAGGTATPPTPTEEKQALIGECVERVLEILEQKAER
ncbi:MAG: DUF5908 family protein [Thermodesulfobacteriota bacterium]